MEAVVQLGELGEVRMTLRGNRVHRVGKRAELLDISMPRGRGEAASPRLEQCAQSKDLLEILRAPALHLHPSVLLVEDEALRCEPTQRLAYGGAAYADVGCQVGLAQPVPAGEIAREDTFADSFVRVLGGAAGLDACGVLGHVRIENSSRIRDQGSMNCMQLLDCRMRPPYRYGTTDVTSLTYCDASYTKASLSVTVAPALPLDDLRVVELGQLLAGPFCGQLLGDFGAEVIKVEDPSVGDPMRQWGREKPYGQSLWWPVVARNKLSVTANLRTESGQDLVRRLLADADVLIENFRPGTLERWGLAPEELWELNPRLIITRVTGFGQDGPYSQRAGYGSIGEAMGGIRYVTGDPDRPPARAGISIGDSLAATFACLGTLVALHQRGRNGAGQVVDSAIYEAVLSMMESMVPEWQVAGYQRERTGPTLPNVSPSNAYPTGDGEMILIAANQDTVFRRLAEVMERPDLATDERYATHSARGVSMEELDGLIAEWTSTFKADDLLERLHEGGVPAGRIFRAKDMFADPHFAARDAIVRLAHPDLGEFAVHNVAPKLSATPGAVRHLGPTLGQHNDEIYRDVLGLGDDEMSSLRAEGVI